MEKKIKFILHGGNISEVCKENKLFFQTCFGNYKKGEKILYIPFAGYDEDWNISKLENKLKIYFNEKFDIVLGEIDNLEQQILKSRYIFINGGDYKKLFNYMGFLENKKDLLLGKIIIGVSAGANILARYSYSNDYEKIFEGLGFLNRKIICHYNGNEKIKDMLNKYPKELPIYTIKEKDFIIL